MTFNGEFESLLAKKRETSKNISTQKYDSINDYILWYR